MTITDLNVHVLKSELDQPFAFSRGRVRRRSATPVQVHTDEGISGWGEAFVQAASLQVMAAIAATLFASQPVLEYDRSGSRSAVSS